MKITKAIKPFATTALALAAIAAISITFSPVQAQNGNGDESKIQQGFAIAPVHLTLAGKNPGLVGLGSYIVNAQASCNSCHDSGPGAEFTLSGNPYVDLDHLHPTCSGAPNENCIPFPFNGALLHAVGYVPKHDRPRHRGHLRISERHPLHRGPTRS